MKLFQKIAIGYVLFIAVLGWGVMIGKFQWFPYRIIEETKDFIAGYDDEDTGILEKLNSDFGRTPSRFIYPFPSLDKTGMVEFSVAGLRERRAVPLMRLTEDAPRGFRLLFGAFDFEDSFWGALLIDPDGKLLNRWLLSTDQLPLSTEPEYRKNMYGVDILPDGSIIFLMQETGGGIVKVDYCGKTMWTLNGVFHHTVSLTEDGKFWTFEGAQKDLDHILTLVDSATGKVVKRIDMKDVRQANPNTHIFDLQRELNVANAVHGNDIKPLPERLAADFPQFASGDLLVSFNTINLLFVLDPDTLAVKWWRVGPWDRQHDPDWNRGGYISVFSNNARSHQRGINMHSNIIAIDPRTYKSRITLAGSKYDFYSSINGMHEIGEQGNVLVTSSTQGRIFEVNNNGKVVFDFVNRYSDDAKSALHVSNARFLDADFFEFDTPPVCGKP